jgi:hypothetical protein
LQKWRAGRCRAMGAGASAREASGFYCHRCQTMLEHLGDGGMCPHCQGGFVEESANALALAQAVQWLVSEDRNANSMEARIARLLDDLREHLASVDGLHSTMAITMDIPATPKLEPAPPEVRNGISEVRMDSVIAQQMRQTPSCVICCSDFEAGELLSQLPGCSHLFHSGCIVQWLERAANCPICRCDLRQAVGMDRRDISTASSVLLDTDRSQYTNAMSPSPSPPGTAYRGLIHPSSLTYSHGPTMWRSPSRNIATGSPDIVSAPSSGGHLAAEGWLFAEGMRPRHSTQGTFEDTGAMHLPLQSTGEAVGRASIGPTDDLGHRMDSLRHTSFPPSPVAPRRGTSSVLVGAGSAISSPATRAVARPGSVAEPRAQRPPSRTD